jgi:hypothetical protein
MMNEARPYASLSSGLLARKGTAKPAMRPQGYNSGFEDLGWNDMGHAPAPEAELPEHVPSSIAALTPLPRNDEPSPVAQQQRALAESFHEEIEAAEELVEPVEAVDDVETAPAPRAKAEVVVLPKRVAAPAVAGRKSAFTLRLDAERHLRLRLACAVTGRSAQQIVINALDGLLASLPEVEALAERVPAGKRR